MSSAAPPTRVSTFETEPVLAKSPSVSLSEPEPRSRLSVAASAAPSVIVSLPEPPTMRLDVRDRDHVGEPSQRQLVGAAAEVDRALREQRPSSVMVSSSVPPMSVSTLASEPVLTKSPSVRLSEPAPRSMLSPVLKTERQRHRIGAADARDRLDVGHRQRVGEVAEGELVGAGAEIDRRVRGDGAQRDGVVVRAAEDALDVRDRGRVGDVLSVSVSGRRRG